MKQRDNKYASHWENAFFFFFPEVNFHKILIYTFSFFNFCCFFFFFQGLYHQKSKALCGDTGIK